MKMCETCGLKHAHYGLQGSGSKKRKWCGGCAEGQAGETQDRTLELAILAPF